MTNLPDPTTRGNFVCRPAALDIVRLQETIPDAGFVSGAVVIGDTLYGMVASSLNPGHDQPFVFDLSVDPPVPIPVSGVTAANTPVSPPATGKWVPPILAQVASRILVTHTGFPGEEIKFGWFDVSGFEATITGNTIEQLQFIGDTVITDDPHLIYGVPPGTLPDEAISGLPSPAPASRPTRRLSASRMLRFQPPAIRPSDWRSSPPWVRPPVSMSG